MLGDIYVDTGGKTEVPNLTLVDKDTYTFKFMWDTDWINEWEKLKQSDKLHFKSVDNLKFRNLWYFVIDIDGNLKEGAYSSFQNLSSNLITHSKVNIYND